MGPRPQPGAGVSPGGAGGPCGSAQRAGGVPRALARHSRAVGAPQPVLCLPVLMGRGPLKAFFCVFLTTVQKR